MDYRWDRNSLRLNITDDNGNQTQYVYDNLDRRLSETQGLCTPPNLADRCDTPTTITYQYDPDHNVTQTVDENGSFVDNKFDAINRLTGISVTRAAGVVGTTARLSQYDGLSRMTLAVDDNGGSPQRCEYVFDSLGRLLEERFNGRPVSNTYTGDGKRVQCVFPGGRVIKNTFDPIGAPPSSRRSATAHRPRD